MAAVGTLEYLLGIFWVSFGFWFSVVALFALATSIAVVAALGVAVDAFAMQPPTKDQYKYMVYSDVVNSASL